MRLISSYKLLFIFLFIDITLFIRADGKEHLSGNNSYYPISNTHILIYKTSFGEESISKTFFQDNIIINSNESPKFKYHQKLEVREDGIYVLETYQYLKIFLFFNKEAKHTYNKPLLHIPFPLVPGNEWHWSGIEYTNNDSTEITVKGKVLNKEKISVPAGNFESIKLETIIENNSNSKNIITEWFSEGVELIKAKIIISGGGMMGLVRDLLGYKEIDFELKEIRNK